MRAWLCAALVVAGCKSEPGPVDSGPKITEPIPTVAAPSVQPGETKANLGGGLSDPGTEPLIGAPALIHSFAAAGDSETPTVITQPPKLVFHRPDGGIVTDAIELIPTRATGTLQRKKTGPRIPDQFLEVDWLLPASLTSKLEPGVHVASVTWGDETTDTELNFRRAPSPQRLAVVTARVNCAAGALKHDARLMLSTVDAGLQALPNDFVLTKCVSDALREQGDYEGSIQALQALPDSPQATRAFFDSLVLPDGGFVP